MSTLEHIKANNRTFGELFADGDADGIADLYTPDAQLFPANSDIVAGTAAIREFWAGLVGRAIATLEIKTHELQDLGATAIDCGRYTLKLHDGTVADHGKYVVIWRNVNGQWKLHRDIWTTSVPAAKTAGA